MDKVSFYNLKVLYKDYILYYNSLSDIIIPFTIDEYNVIEELLTNLDEFKKEYPVLYKEMYNRGFIIDEKFNELSFIKLQNNRVIYSSNRYHIIINPTLDCNLKCWYCSTEYAKAIHSGRMNDDIILRTKKHLKKIIEEERVKELHLDWFGGEPLLYFDEVINPIASFVKNLLTKNIKYTQHITTNATLLTDERIHLMKDLGFTSFQIPIDGNEHRHNKIKFYSDKTGCYKHIINNINKITEFIPDVKIILRINYDQQTLKNILDITKDLSDDCKKTLLIDFQKVWQIPNREEEKKLLKEVKKEFNDLGYDTTFWAFVPKRYHRCYADRYNNYAINYDGRIFKCTARDYADDKVIGTLKQEGDIDWNYQLLGELFDKSTFENEKCLICKKLPICMGPCITSNFEARKKGIQIPCNMDYSQYSFDSYIIEEALKRKIILK